MKFSRSGGVVLLVAVLAATPALAFEETGAGKKDGPAAEKSLELSGGKAPAKPSAGGGISIPGIGNLGVLPKLDFGLELLYGDQPPVAAREAPSTREDGSEDGDFRIRGTFKHRF